MMLGKTFVAIAALMSASAASAQWMPGMEIAGQDVEVQTNGVVNRVHFDQSGTATIASPTGATMVNATWTANDGKLCVNTADTAACYPYARPFTAQAPVDLKSDCGIVSRWTALSTAVMPGERG